MRPDFILLTQAVTSKAQVIRVDPSPIIAQVKGRFPRIRCSCVSIGDEHLCKGNTIEKTSTIVADIMKSQAFAVVEAHPQAPLLPVDALTANAK